MATTWVLALPIQPQPWHRFASQPHSDAVFTEGDLSPSPPKTMGTAQSDLEPSANAEQEELRAQDTESKSCLSFCALCWN